MQESALVFLVGLIQANVQFCKHKTQKRYRFNYTDLTTPGTEHPGVQVLDSDLDLNPDSPVNLLWTFGSKCLISHYVSDPWVDWVS